MLEFSPSFLLKWTSFSPRLSILFPLAAMYVTPVCVRGALLAKGPDSSSGEVHRGSGSEDIHMEEEKVEVTVQEDEVEDGRDK